MTKKKTQPTKEQIIDMFFKKPNLLGNRYCGPIPDFMINRKEVLLKKNLYNYWNKTTWAEFNVYLEEYYHNKRNNERGDDFDKLDWSFIYE